MAMGRPFDLPYSVEVCDDSDQHIEELIALTGDYGVARAAYDEAIKRRPGKTVTLRQKARVLADSRRTMTRIYISDVGDDRNDGLTRETAIYSWQRAVKLCDGNKETNLMQGDATLQRLIEEIAKRRNIGAEKTDSQ